MDGRSCPWLHVHWFNFLLNADRRLHTLKRDGHIAYLITTLDVISTLPLEVDHPTELAQNRNGQRAGACTESVVSTRKLTPSSTSAAHLTRAGAADHQCNAVRYRGAQAANSSISNDHLRARVLRGW
jgi:hypothetical protein